MKKALFAFTIGILHYSVFHMIVCAMYEGKLTLWGLNPIDCCVMWLCIFTVLILGIADLIEDKLFPKRIERLIKRVVIEHFELLKKYDRLDLFAEALEQLVREEAGKMKKKKRK